MSQPHDTPLDSRATFEDSQVLTDITFAETITWLDLSISEMHTELDRAIEHTNDLALVKYINDFAPVQITEFHLFPTLPPEIRLRIWHLALPAARVVDYVKFSGCAKARELNNHAVWFPVKYSWGPNPDEALSFVNFESRVVFHKSYVWTGFANWSIGSTQLLVGNGFINPERDTLYLNPFNSDDDHVCLLDYDGCWITSPDTMPDVLGYFKEKFRKYFGSDVVSRLRHLALAFWTIVTCKYATDTRRKEFGPDFPDIISSLVSIFPALEEVSVVLGRGSRPLGELRLSELTADEVARRADFNEWRWFDNGDSKLEPEAIVEACLTHFFRDTPDRKLPKVTVKMGVRVGQPRPDFSVPDGDAALADLSC